MSNTRTITFKTTLDPAGLQATLRKIGIIKQTVDLFDLAAIVEAPGGATVKLLSKDRSVTVVIGGQHVNRAVATRMQQLGGVETGRYNHRTGARFFGFAPGDSHSVSSKTKLGKLMKFLGADAAAVKAFRTVSPSNLLKITDMTDEDTAPGVTRVEVFTKDDRVTASWDAVVADVDLNVPMRCTASCSIQHRELRYEIEFDYASEGPINMLREMMSSAGFEPFDGDID